MQQNLTRFKLALTFYQRGSIISYAMLQLRCLSIRLSITLVLYLLIKVNRNNNQMTEIRDEFSDSSYTCCILRSADYKISNI